MEAEKKQKAPKKNRWKGLQAEFKKVIWPEMCIRDRAMDLTDLYSTYERINTVSPRTLLKIVLYSYMNGDYSSRSMELNCKRDINFMYLLEGKPVPDHATFARFRSIHFAPCAKRILAEMANLFYELGEISGETIFIDGTKIEACANKYTFV